MKKSINEEMGKIIIEKYNNHVRPKILAEEFGVNETTIVRYLKKVGIYDNAFHSKYYDYIKPIKVTWTQEETDYLIQNYNNLSIDEIYRHYNKRHSKKGITKKAMSLNLTINNDWSKSEDEILLKYYSTVDKQEILRMLPGRSINAIVCRAMKLNVKSKRYLDEQYSEEQKVFIKENSSLMTDAEIANALNKPLSGIQEQRRKLGIYYMNKDYSNYESFLRLFRGYTASWKKQSMEKCGYKCIFTGTSDFEIHHLHAFNLIVAETFHKLDDMGLLKSHNIDDYTQEEIQKIINVFLCIHSSYPLGVCVARDIHHLFHSIYGNGGNTETQWNAFVQDYKAGKYNV